MAKSLINVIDREIEAVTAAGGDADSQDEASSAADQSPVFDAAVEWMLQTYAGSAIGVMH